MQDLAQGPLPVQVIVKYVCIFLVRNIIFRVLHRVPNWDMCLLRVTGSGTDSGFFFNDK